MPDKLKVRVSVDLEGELAEAFLEELGERVKTGGSPSKADLGRIMIAEALQRRGHKVDAPETNWGGRPRPADEEGQLAAVAVA